MTRTTQLYLKLVYDRLRALPFQVAMAGLALVSGTTGLLHIGTATDSLTLLFPTWLVLGLNVTYIMSGVCMILGLALPRRDVEGFGLVQLGAAVVVRGVAVALVAGLNPDVLSLYTLYAMILWACYQRLKALFKAKAVATRAAK